MGSRANRCGSVCWLCHLQALCPWPDYPTSLCLSFISVKGGWWSPYVFWFGGRHRGVSPYETYKAFGTTPYTWAILGKCCLLLLNVCYMPATGLWGNLSHLIFPTTCRVGISKSTLQMKKLSKLSRLRPLALTCPGIWMQALSSKPKWFQLQHSILCQRFLWWTVTNKLKLQSKQRLQFVFEINKGTIKWQRRSC